MENEKKTLRKEKKYFERKKTLEKTCNKGTADYNQIKSKIYLTPSDYVQS